MCIRDSFSGELDRKNFKADTIDVKAEVSLEKIAESWSISTVHLIVKASVPGASYSQVQEAAELAKQNCPVSKLLKANITMDLEFNEAQEQSAMV